MGGRASSHKIRLLRLLGKGLMRKPMANPKTLLCPCKGQMTWSGWCKNPLSTYHIRYLFPYLVPNYFPFLLIIGYFIPSLQSFSSQPPFLLSFTYKRPFYSTYLFIESTQCIDSLLYILSPSLLKHALYKFDFTQNPCWSIVVTVYVLACCHHGLPHCPCHCQCHV